MKKFILLTASLFAVGLSAQTELRVLDGSATMLMDINDNGQAVHRTGYYDFNTDTSTAAEAGVTQTNRINNSGDVAGNTLFIAADESEIDQAAFRKDGSWTNIGFFPGANPTNSWFGTGNSISNNSKYITGQISTSAADTYAYLYNTETSTLTKLTDGDDVWLYARGSGVNDDGYVVGFVDREDFFDAGSYWVAAYFDPAGMLHYIDIEHPEMGEASDINNAGIIVGYQGNKAFTYNVNTNEYKSFGTSIEIPKPVFTSISEEGLILGYCGEAGNREAIVYHEGLLKPMLLKDYLIQQGINISTFDEKMGTGMGVSDNGKFLSGFDNAYPPITATGWVVHLDGLPYGPGCLDAPNGQYPSTVFVPACSGSAETIVSDAKTGEYSLVQLSANKEYVFSSSVSTDFITILNEAGNQILAYGTGSATFSSFEDQVVRFVLNLDDECNYSNDTRAKSVVCQNPSGCLWTVYVYDDNIGDEVSWSLKDMISGDTLLEGNGYNYGFYDLQTVYSEGPVEFHISTVGVFNDNTPNYSVSNGTEVLVEGIMEGGTESTFSDLNCATMGIEQVDLNSLQIYPNPVVDLLNISSTQTIKQVSVYTLDGRKLRTDSTLNSKSGQVQMTGLPQGIYFVKIKFENSNEKTIKVIKK